LSKLLRNSIPLQLTMLISLLLLINTFVEAQESASSSEILLGLKKLNVLGSVLYIAAHPDDENTAVLTYMSKSKLVNTAYLSLTRGDGGQNLLGYEKGDLLGVLRTQELLSARRIDGADQFFSRAIDFGYSKTAEETLSKWDRTILLGDIVKVIRQFRPDIIITRFSSKDGGHGHHLSSAILAEEAFFAAADPTKYPEQLEELKIWQTKRIYWNTWRPSEQAVSLDIGEYNSLLGKSYNEISALGRSMHKSQGFGATPTRGSQKVYFDLIAGEPARKNLFDDIEISWDRVEGSDKIEESINNATNDFEPEHPENSIKILIDIYDELDKIDNNFWGNRKKKEVKNLIKLCSGLWIESSSSAARIFPGGEIEVTSKIISRSNIPVKLQSIQIPANDKIVTIDKFLEQNESFVHEQTISILENSRYFQPYWLYDEHGPNMFSIPSDDYIGRAANHPDLTTQFEFLIGEYLFSYEIPVEYRWNDAVKGEQTSPFVIIPKISLSVERDTYIFSSDSARSVRVHVETKEDNQKGILELVLPVGWKASPEKIKFDLYDAGDRKSFIFNVIPSSSSEDGKLQLTAMVDGKIFENEIIEIDYSHISHQTVLQKAEAKLVKLNIKTEPRRIGYVMGSGDDIPDALIQLGFNVNLLTDGDLDNADLSEYNVIICGIRAFNTRKDLSRQQKSLSNFVKNGGTWIVQHNTRFGTQVDQIGPYKFSTSGRDRISQEDAPLKILLPDHQIFNYPNKITETDFNNWVQERGLYFASSWDSQLTPLLEGNDKGESPKLGSLLYSEYGKGVFIFTALSWFRQLPAGVPGSYRLFVNLVSARGGNE